MLWLVLVANGPLMNLENMFDHVALLHPAHLLLDGRFIQEH